MGTYDFKVLNKSKKFLMIILILDSAEILSILWMTHITDWVYASMRVTSVQNHDILKFDGTIFKGSLFQCTSGCSGSYKTNMKDWCIYEELSQDIPSKSICGLFVSLFYSSMIFTALQYLSIFLSFLHFFGVYSFIKNRKYQEMTDFALIYQFVFVLISNIFWTIINEISFQGNCREFPQNGRAISLCLGIGPKFSYAFVGVSFLLYLINKRIFDKIKEIKNLESSPFKNIIPIVDSSNSTNDIYKRQEASSSTVFELAEEIKNIDIKEESHIICSGFNSSQSVESFENLNDEKLKVQSMKEESNSN